MTSISRRPALDETLVRRGAEVHRDARVVDQALVAFAAEGSIGNVVLGITRDVDLDGVCSLIKLTAATGFPDQTG